MQLNYKHFTSEYLYVYLIANEFETSNKKKLCYVFYILI